METNVKELMVEELVNEGAEDVIDAVAETGSELNVGKVLGAGAIVAAVVVGATVLYKKVIGPKLAALKAKRAAAKEEAEEATEEAE